MGSKGSNKLKRKQDFRTYKKKIKQECPCTAKCSGEYLFQNY